MPLHKLTVSAIMCDAVYFSLLAKLKHVKGSVSVHTRLHDLTPDVLVYIVLTLKNVVLIAVAIDVCTSVILGDNVVYFSLLAKLKHVKGSVSVHAQVARLDAGRRWSTLS